LKTQAIFFSPTNSTQKIISTISDALKFEKLHKINLTIPSKRKIQNVGADADIIIFGAPVYIGRIPSMIVPCIKNMIGKNRWIIPIVVYGNTKLDKALNNMIHLFREQGFRILGAGSFIGEHSFTCKDFKLAESRPDIKDLRKAREFGQKLREKLQNTPREIEIVGEKPDFSKLNQEYKARGLVKIIKAHEEKCTRCMGCWSICPTEAIDMFSIEIDEEKCFRCCACVKACKFDVFKIKITMPKETEEIFMEFAKVRKEPEFFL